MLAMMPATAQSISIPAKGIPMAIQSPLRRGLLYIYMTWAFRTTWYKLVNLWNSIPTCADDITTLRVYRESTNGGDDCNYIISFSKRFMIGFEVSIDPVLTETESYNAITAATANPIIYFTKSIFGLRWHRWMGRYHSQWYHFGTVMPEWILWYPLISLQTQLTTWLREVEWVQIHSFLFMLFWESKGYF